MSDKSPLHSAKPDTVSVAGKLLSRGQTITVPKSAIGKREKRAEARGKIEIRASNKPGYVQIVCTLKG